LIQTIGRAARNIRGKAIMYAAEVTESMRQAIDETERRRRRQAEYNVAHGITPKGIVKAVKEIIDGVQPRAPSTRSRRYAAPTTPAAAEEAAGYDAMAPDALGRQLKKLEKRMYEHAKNLEFEEAAQLRDKIRAIRERRFGLIQVMVR
jgi:excinuclease ABC subunit B